MADIEDLVRQKEALLAKKREKEEMLARLRQQGITPPQSSSSPPGNISSSAALLNAPLSYSSPHEREVLAPPPVHAPAPLQRPVRTSGPPKKYVEPEIIDVITDKSHSKRNSRKRKRASEDDVDEDFLFGGPQVGGDEDDDVDDDIRIDMEDDDFGSEKIKSKGDASRAQRNKRQNTGARSQSFNGSMASTSPPVAAAPLQPIVPSYSSKMASNPLQHSAPAEDGGRKRATRTQPQQQMPSVAPPQYLPQRTVTPLQGQVRGPIAHSPPLPPTPPQTPLTSINELLEIRHLFTSQQKLIGDIDYRLGVMESSLNMKLDRMQRSIDVLMHQIGADRDPSLQGQSTPPPAHHTAQAQHHHHYGHDGSYGHHGSVNVLDDFDQDYSDLIK